MAVPDYQSLMLPLLRRVAEAGRPTGIAEMMPLVAADLQLTEADLAERLPSGRQGLLHNRLHWSKYYLVGAGVLQSTRRGLFEITTTGRALLAENPPVINNEVLSRYPAFRAWLMRSRAGTEAQGSDTTLAIVDHVGTPVATPEERIEAARRELDAGLRSEVLSRVRQMDPGDFEQLIITLLLRMQYGQGRDELAQVLGGSGDGGVDGVVHQDPLGLDRVYIQAKRYKEGNPVGPEAINSFIGALNIKRANKGLFVTASSFTKQAREHAERSTTHVVLIDGERLADLMVRHGVGVVVRDAIEIKAVDEGFFGE